MNRTKRFFFHITLAAGMTLAGASLVSAQPGAEGRGRGDDAACSHHEGGRGHHGRRHGPGMIHRALSQLDLSENQREQVRAIFETSRERGQELRDQARSPERREAFRALMQETHGLIDDVLTPAQRQEFQAIRARGVDRRLEHMTERLSLTPAQATQIRTIMLEAMAEGPPRHREVHTRIRAVLTPEQQAQLPERGRHGRRGEGNRGRRGR